jgi:hypothetical protein
MSVRTRSSVFPHRCVGKGTICSSSRRHDPHSHRLDKVLIRDSIRWP